MSNKNMAIFYIILGLLLVIWLNFIGIMLLLPIIMTLHNKNGYKHTVIDHNIEKCIVIIGLVLWLCTLIGNYKMTIASMLLSSVYTSIKFIIFLLLFSIEISVISILYLNKKSVTGAILLICSAILGMTMRIVYNISFPKVTLLFYLLASFIVLIKESCFYLGLTQKSNEP